AIDQLGEGAPLDLIVGDGMLRHPGAASVLVEVLAGIGGGINGREIGAGGLGRGRGRTTAGGEEEGGSEERGGEAELHDGKRIAEKREREEKVDAPFLTLVAPYGRLASRLRPPGSGASPQACSLWPSTQCGSRLPQRNRRAAALNLFRAGLAGLPVVGSRHPRLGSVLQHQHQ